MYIYSICNSLRANLQSYRLTKLIYAHNLEGTPCRKQLMSHCIYRKGRKPVSLLSDCSPWNDASLLYEKPLASQRQAN